MRYDYCGERVPLLIPLALYEGFRDAKRLPRDGNLYRSGWPGNVTHRLLWRVGRWLGGLLK